jgi:hypothetical protein
MARKHERGVRYRSCGGYASVAGGETRHFTAIAQNAKGSKVWDLQVSCNLLGQIQCAQIADNFSNEAWTAEFNAAVHRIFTQHLGQVELKEITWLRFAE